MGDSVEAHAGVAEVRAEADPELTEERQRILELAAAQERKEAAEANLDRMEQVLVKAAAQHDEAKRLVAEAKRALKEL